MLLAADVGGTKTLIGLFRPDGPRPTPLASRVYATAQFQDLSHVVRVFLNDVESSASEARPSGRPGIHAFCAGVAGPVTGLVAGLTNLGWTADAGAVARAHGDCPVALLNDLEAMAYGVPVLHADELVALHDPGTPVAGNAALIAAGTGLGEAVLQRIDGRFVPAASEGGHADFAARTPRELALVPFLSALYGRVDTERVVSGPGIANLFAFVHGGRSAGACDAIDPDVSERDLPHAVTEAALAGACERCKEALDMFVSAYGAEAGNLALRAMATGGVYVAGGVAPKILPALLTGPFMTAFLDKAPMRDLMRRIPVRVVLNPNLGLIGASVRAAALAAGAGATR